MAFKFIIFIASLAVASAGLGEPVYAGGLGVAYSAAPQVSHVYNSYGLASLDDHLSVGVSDQNIVRSYGGTVSQISKKVVSPTSIVTKSDTRINNAGIKTIAYQQPAYGYAAQPAYGYAAQKLIAQPALSYAQPLAYAQPSYGISTHGNLGYAAQKVIAQPAVSYAQPLAYAQPSYGYAAQKVIAQPALLQKSVIAQPAISYSAPAVSYAAAAPVLQKSYISQPAVAYAQPSYGYAAQKVIAQPALSYAQPLAYAAQPTLLGAQSYVKTTYASPVANYGW